MKNKKIWLFALSIVMLVGTLVVYTVYAKKSQDRVVFSWQTEALDDGGVKLFEVLESVDANIVYQNIDAHTDEKRIKKFLKSAYKRKISVYLLAGDHEWCLENNATPYVERLEQVQQHNSLVKKKYAIKGVVYDVEPYTLEEWNTNKEMMMDNYVKSMKNTHETAKELGLSVVACIPYFYEEKGMQKEMKKLLKNGCDEVAVMNYYRKNEIKHIKTEANYAKKYGKKLINIYEFNPAGTHGLIKRNTYYHLGLKKANKQFKKIQKYFNKQEVAMGMHDAEILKEVMGLE